MISNLTKLQQKFHNSDVNFAVFVADRSAGKTHALLAEFDKYRKVQDFRGLYVSTYDSYHTFEKAKKMYSRPGVRFDNKRRSVTFPSGATIIFVTIKSQEDLYRLSGREFDLVVVDDIDEFTAPQLQYIRSLNRSCKGNVPKFRGSCQWYCGLWLEGLLEEPVQVVTG
jgi:phage terminase large subunit-like protein